MSTVTYKIDEKEYSFSTDLQIVNLLSVETILIDEIKQHKHTNDITGMIHDVTLIDENGLIVHAKEFKNNNVNLEIKNIKQ